MKEYLSSVEEVLKEKQASEDGLSGAQAQERLERYGKNKLQEGKKTSLMVRFLQQLADPMVIILLVAAALSGITAFYEGESFTEVAIILIVVIINTVLGVFQESKAEKAIEALQQMSSPYSKVKRSGHVISIKSEDIVPGDIVKVELSPYESVTLHTIL